MPDKKKAAPTAALKLQQHHNSAKPPLEPKSQREKRLLSALAQGGVLRHELDRIIGTDNAPEYVSRLRLAGWEIQTERVPSYDRDGSKIRVGRYHLSRVHQALARLLLAGG